MQPTQPTPTDQSATPQPDGALSAHTQPDGSLLLTAQDIQAMHDNFANPPSIMWGHIWATKAALKALIEYMSPNTNSAIGPDEADVLLNLLHGSTPSPAVEEIPAAE